MDPVITADFSIEVDRDEVFRLLRVPKLGGDRISNAPSQAVDLYGLVLAEARELVAPKAIYTLCAAEAVRYHEVFRKASHLAFSVCTIGPRLEDKVLEYAGAGESMKALMLDAVGSCAVESVVEETAGRISELAGEMGMRTSVRFSPGYGKWRLEEQPWLFKVVDGDAVGVVLNDSCVMKPRKSVSFAVRIGTDPDARD